MGMFKGSVPDASQLILMGIQEQLRKELLKQLRESVEPLLMKVAREAAESVTAQVVGHRSIERGVTEVHVRFNNEKFTPTTI